MDLCKDSVKMVAILRPLAIELATVRSHVAECFTHDFSWLELRLWLRTKVLVYLTICG